MSNIKKLIALLSLSICVLSNPANSGDNYERELERAKEIGTIEAYSRLLSKYRYNDPLVIERISELVRKQSEEHATYFDAKESGNLDLYKKYLNKYPNGKYIEQANEEMKALKDKLAEEDRRAKNIQMKREARAERHRKLLADIRRTNALPNNESIGSVLSKKVEFSSVYEELVSIKHLSKGKFEKTSEYNARKKQAISKLSGAYLIELKKFRIKYDADSESWKIVINRCYICSAFDQKPKVFDLVVSSESVDSNFIGTNSYGVSVDVRMINIDKNVLRIDDKRHVSLLREISENDYLSYNLITYMGINQAKQTDLSSSRLYILFSINLNGKSDYVSDAHDHKSATLSDPVESSQKIQIINILPKAIVVHNDALDYVNYINITPR